MSTGLEIPTPLAAGNGKVQEEMGSQYLVKRMFFPSHGRLKRRLNHRSRENGQEFVGFVWSCWWGPFCAFLVYKQPPLRT